MLVGNAPVVRKKVANRRASKGKNDEDAESGHSSEDQVSDGRSDDGDAEEEDIDDIDEEGRMYDAALRQVEAEERGETAPADAPPKQWDDSSNWVEIPIHNRAVSHRNGVATDAPLIPPEPDHIEYLGPVNIPEGAVRPVHMMELLLDDAILGVFVSATNSWVSKQVKPLWAVAKCLDVIELVLHSVDG